MKIDTRNAHNGILIYNFDDDLPSVRFDVNDEVHFDNCITAMMMGFNDRIKDRAAIPRKQKVNGVEVVVNVTETMRRDKVVEVIDHLNSGTDQWNLKSSARAPKQDPSIAALAAKLNITYDEALAKIAEIALKELMDS